MWWMRPIPTVRWLAATVIVVGALAADLRGPPTVDYPFAITDLPAGTPLTDGAVEYRPVALDTLPDPLQAATHLTVGVTAGTPLVPAVVGTEPVAPAGWWTVDVPLSPSAVAGDTVRIVVIEPATTVIGVVVVPGISDTFSGDVRGVVAIPEDAADLVARAVAAGSVVTLGAVR